MTTAISASDATLTPSRNAPAERRAAEPRHERPAQRDEDERGQEDAERRDRGARRSAEHVADERRGREHGTRRDLADGDGVEQLRLGEPAEPLDEIGAQEREQDVAAAEEHRADLEEDDEQRRTVRRNGARPSSRRPRD